MDATEDFEAVHSTRAMDMLNDYYVGPLSSSRAAKKAGGPLAAVARVAGMVPFSKFDPAMAEDRCTRGPLASLSKKYVKNGGTGLTPCYLRFLYANRTPDDILARDILEELAAKHPDRFVLTLTVDRIASEEAKNESAHQENDWQFAEKGGNLGTAAGTAGRGSQVRQVQCDALPVPSLPFTWRGR
eukprot:s219_g31.t1